MSKKPTTINLQEPKNSSEAVKAFIRMTPSEKLNYLSSFERENPEHRKFMSDIISVPGNIAKMKELCKDNNDVRRAYSILLAQEFKHNYTNSPDKDKDVVLDNFRTYIQQNKSSESYVMREESLVFLELDDEQMQMRLLKKWHASDNRQLDDLRDTGSNRSQCYENLAKKSIEIVISMERQHIFSWVSEEQIDIEESIKRDYNNLLALEAALQSGVPLDNVAKKLSIDTLTRSKYLFNDTGYFGPEVQAKLIDSMSSERVLTVGKSLAKNNLQDQKKLLNLSFKARGSVFFWLPNSQKQEMLDLIEDPESKEELNMQISYTPTITQTIKQDEKQLGFVKRQQLSGDVVISRAVVGFLASGADYFSSRDENSITVEIDFTKKDQYTRLKALLNVVGIGQETKDIDAIVKHINQRYATKDAKIPLLALSSIINSARGKEAEINMQKQLNNQVKPVANTKNNQPPPPLRRSHEREVNDLRRI